MPDLTDQSIPAMSWTPIGSGNVVTRRFDLSRYFRNGDTQDGDPTATVLAPAGDTDPLTIGDPAWETDSRIVRIPPGVDYTSPGPRIAIPITGGGTRGNTYAVVAQFVDTDGQTRTVVAWQFVQYDALPPSPPSPPSPPPPP